MPPVVDRSLPHMHPLLAQWFRSCVGTPTDVQAQAWDSIAKGEHVLVTAPTGTGKTLTAFLWALHQLITGKWPCGRLAVLYISPLKALNNDIQRNLLEPLEELRERFERAAEAFPNIRVQTRSGDTSPADRRKMFRHPPEILITTPESLNLLLSSKSGLEMLNGVQCVIMDEIHSVVNSKRGTHLITAVDRLVPLYGEFQRIALSATVKPMETVAGFVAGFLRGGTRDAPTYTPRPIRLLRSGLNKQYHIEVCFSLRDDDAELHGEAMGPLIEDIKERIAGNRSTLVFVNGRRMAEKVTRLINAGEERPIAYAHHGSLSREIRTEVEQQLKQGRLRAIVATSSLEMGIDIGALDEVVQILPPATVAAAIQRAGRAGHRVGETSRTSFHCLHGQQLIESVVLAREILEHNIEAVQPVHCPLDVLAQVLTSMVGLRERNIDDLFCELRASYPYRDLPRRQFDLVLEMLAGRYADTRLRDLRARVSIDRMDNTAKARRGALQALYTSGGTIPDRGYFNLRHHQTNARIGELDEEFVWEAAVGDNFVLGTQNWRIQAITHNDVFALPKAPDAKSTPFWRGEDAGRGFHLSQQIATFMEEAEGYAQEGGLEPWLEKGFHLTPQANAKLIEYIVKQRAQTGAALPHRHHLLVEHIGSGPKGAQGNQTVLHTLWGGRVNRPYAMALEAAWEQRFAQHIEVFVGNDGIALQLPEHVDTDVLLSLVTSANVDDLLRARLGGSGFFGARFREAAGRALLLSRRKFNERLPLWMTRLRSQKLLDAVRDHGDFPITLEAWRCCLQDELDLSGLRSVLAELESGRIRVGESFTGGASPMADLMSWRQVNDYMYWGEEPKGGRGTKSSVTDDLLRDLVNVDSLRPRVPQSVCDDFAMKLHRVAPGYAPRDGSELLDWVVERVLIPTEEWVALLGAMGTAESEEALAQAGGKLGCLRGPAGELGIVALEMVPRVVAALFEGPELAQVLPLDGSACAGLALDPDVDRDTLSLDLIGQFMQFYGPLDAALLGAKLGLAAERWAFILEHAQAAELVVHGQLIRDDDNLQVCDRRNFESLLRLARAAAVPVFEPLTIGWLAPLLARMQGLGVTSTDDELRVLQQSLEQLLCLPLPAKHWETEILPARVMAYRPDHLDRLLGETELRWIGEPGKKLSFCLEGELDLCAAAEASARAGENGARSLFVDPLGRYDLTALARSTEEPLSQLYARLWESVWGGELTSDSLAAVRRGLESGFEESKAVSPVSGGGRSRRGRWRRGTPLAGTWRLLPEKEGAADRLEIEELNKDRVRILLDRYGILFRQLLTREAPGFRWAQVFRSLRLMELSGEVVGGCFFHGIDGLQFMSHRAFRRLSDGLDGSHSYWLNACDPASLCGLSLTLDGPALPRRVPTTHLAYCGEQLRLVSRRAGRELEFHFDPSDERFSEHVAPLRHLLVRSVQPKRLLTVETINGQSAPGSPYLPGLRACFDVVLGPKDVCLGIRRN